MTTQTRMRGQRSVPSPVEAGRVTELIEPAERGEWSITRMEVGEQDAKLGHLRALISSSSRGRWVPPGTYTALRRHGAMVMSDTPDELRDLLGFAWNAKGRVLINGLGLGCALKIALAKSEVERVDVVEVDPDVLALTSPYFAGDLRVQFHLDDAYTIKFRPGTRWNTVWHDIWDNISSDNDFATLHRRYGNRCDWQGSWCKEEAQQSRWR